MGNETPNKANMQHNRNTGGGGGETRHLVLSAYFDAPAYCCSFLLPLLFVFRRRRGEMLG